MQSKVVIISFQLDALQEFQKHTKNKVPLWYLVKEVNDKTIEEAKSLGALAGIDFNATNEKTTKEMVDKAAQAGLELGCWTIDDLETLDKMVS